MWIRETVEHVHRPPIHSHTCECMPCPNNTNTHNSVGLPSFMPPQRSMCKVARVRSEPFELIFDSACRSQTVYNFILMWMHVTCSARPAARHRSNSFHFFFSRILFFRCGGLIPFGLFWICVCLFFIFFFSSRISFCGFGQHSAIRCASNVRSHSIFGWIFVSHALDVR